MNPHRILRSFEGLRLLDRPAGVLSRFFGRLIDRSRLGGILRGSWLGHPVHPLLVTIPIGTWTASAVFDVLFKDVATARRLVGVGLVAVPPTLLAGWADYVLLDKPQQRVGLVHALSNAVGVSMFGLAYRAYGRDRNRAARTFVILGLVAIGVGGALGGHLSYAQGAGMFRWQPVRALTPVGLDEYRRAA